MPGRRNRFNMKTLTLISAFFISLAFNSCTRTIYIVRHAEKAVAPTDSLGKMSNDPPLSEAGKVRAIILKDELHNKHIRQIYSTNTVRTFYTAEPLSKAIHVDIKVYRDIDSLVRAIRSLRGNSLIVGHSNTVDDLVNKLSGKINIPGDLKDYEYDNLFVIKFKGKKATFGRRKYGYPSNP